MRCFKFQPSMQASSPKNLARSTNSTENENKTGCCGYFDRPDLLSLFPSFVDRLIGADVSHDRLGNMGHNPCRRDEEEGDEDHYRNYSPYEVAARVGASFGSSRLPQD